MAGVTNKYIDSVLEDTSNLYMGCFSANNIPTKLLTKNEFSVICNLSSKEEIGTHFVCIIRTPDKLMYLDPYGLPCFIDSITTFLARFSKPVFYNSIQIQSLNSNFCGIYCILFVLAYENNVLFDLRFANDLIHNEQLCISMIEHILRYKAE